jgi:hypothetical protein
MSFTSIPNQPIIFNPTSEVQCEGCGTPYQQLVDFNDEIFFQVETTPCEGSELYAAEITNAGWGAVVDGLACSDALLSGGYYQQDLYMNYSYDLFQVTFTIQSLEQGSLTVEILGSSSYTFTLAGTYTLYFNNPTITASSITLRFTSTSWIGCLNAESIVVNGLASEQQMKIGIVDAETLETIDFITPTYTVKDNKITGAFALTDLALSAGCYRLALVDFCTNTCGQSYVFNGNLMINSIGVEGWTLSGDVLPVLSLGSAMFDINVMDGSSVMTSNTGVQLCEGLTYNVSVFIQSRTDVIIYAVMGANQVEISGSGSQTVSIVAGVGASYLQIFVEQNGGVGTGSAELTRRIAVEVADEDITWNAYTDVLSIGDYNDTCKYYKIEGCNAEDQFNLAFGSSSFLPAIRLEGRKFRAQYQTEVNNFRFASGNWSSTYVDREKKWTFNFGRLPEYVLDFLSTIFYYDNCYVNGDLYYPIDGEFPDVEYNDADDLGAISIDLALKKSKVRKILCSNTDADCLPSILNNDEPFILTEDGQRITTEDSVNLYYEN